MVSEGDNAIMYLMYLFSFLISVGEELENFRGLFYALKREEMV